MGAGKWGEISYLAFLTQEQKVRGEGFSPLSRLLSLLLGRAVHPLMMTISHLGWKHTFRPRSNDVPHQMVLAELIIVITFEILILNMTATSNTNEKLTSNPETTVTAKLFWFLSHQ